MSTLLGLLVSYFNIKNTPSSKEVKHNLGPHVDLGLGLGLGVKVKDRTVPDHRTAPSRVGATERSELND